MRKRTIKPLPGPQKQTLLEMYRHHPKSRMRERAHMVLLSSQKRSIKEIWFTTRGNHLNRGELCRECMERYMQDIQRGSEVGLKWGHEVHKVRSS